MYFRVFPFLFAEKGTHKGRIVRYVTIETFWLSYKVALVLGCPFDRTAISKTVKGRYFTCILPMVLIASIAPKLRHSSDMVTKPIPSS